MLSSTKTSSSLPTAIDLQNKTPKLDEFYNWNNWN